MIREVRNAGPITNPFNELVRAVNKLSRRNAEPDIQRVLKRVPYRRLGSGESSSSGSGSIYGLVVISLSHESNDDIDSYRIRLATDATEAWVQPISPETAYSFGDLVIHGGKKYVSALEGTNNNYDEPGTTSNWVEDSELSISKTYSDKDLSPARDLRHYVPWFSVGSKVKIKQDGGVWYIDETLIYGGTELVSSLRYSETDGRTRVVVV